MGQGIDPRQASIDGLIDWLATRRRSDPARPLSQLLADHRIDQRRLVDIACIDLMQRRRMEHPVTAEQYVEEFPCLASETHLLDLIDAEICIATELGQIVDVSHYTKRFPALAEQIRQLFDLDACDEKTTTSARFADSTPGIVASTATGVDGELDRGDFSVQRLPEESPPRHLSSLAAHPLDAPDWFIGDHCVASSPGRWLIRGRDSVRGVASALKVIQLPALVSDAQRKEILDACEAVSTIRHPAWIVPSVAAIEHRHLGVIRPWVFARPWLQQATSGGVKTRLRQLATVAFAIQAAHRRGATHGGIHAENLVVDHGGSIKILDGGSSWMGLQRWLNPSMDGGATFASLSHRKRIDAKDVIKLVAAAAVQWHKEWATDLVVRLRAAADSSPDDACAELGHLIMRHADSLGSDDAGPRAVMEDRSTWRRRIGGWLTRNE